MRTSLIEIEQIENYLLKKGDIQDRLLTEATILTDPKWKENADWQSKSHNLIHLYGREKLKQEIKAIEWHLFNSTKHKSFQNKMRSIFKR